MIIIYEYLPIKDLTLGVGLPGMINAFISNLAPDDGLPTDTTILREYPQCGRYMLLVVITSQWVSPTFRFDLTEYGETSQR